MASVTGITVAKALQIENASIISGAVSESTGHLILTTKGGSTIDAGLVSDVDATINNIVNGRIDPNKHLILVKNSGEEIDLGPVYPVPTKVVYTENGTFVKADYPGLTRVKVELFGGGGGGGGAHPGSGGSTTEESSGGGGGAGGYFEIELLASALIDSVNVVVGSGGAGGFKSGVEANRVGGRGGMTEFQNPIPSLNLLSISTGGGGGGCSINATPAVERSGGNGGQMPDTLELLPIGEMGSSASEAAPGVNQLSSVYRSPAKGVWGRKNSTDTPRRKSLYAGYGGGGTADGDGGGVPGGGGGGGARDGYGSGTGGNGARGEVRVTVYYD